MGDIDEPLLDPRSDVGATIPAGPTIQEKIRALVTEEPYSVVCTQEATTNLMVRWWPFRLTRRYAVERLTVPAA